MLIDSQGEPAFAGYLQPSFCTAIEGQFSIRSVSSAIAVRLILSNTLQLQLLFPTDFLSYAITFESGHEYLIARVKISALHQ